MNILGIDIGGTGIKAAIVDTKRGELATERIRIKTPDDPTPERVLDVIITLRDKLDWHGPVGCGYPGVIREGRVLTAANLHPEWIHFPLQERLRETFQEAAHCVNDADAAGVAETTFGAASKVSGVILLLTVGTGIGSALFNQGHLIPNTELGHMLINTGKIAQSAEKFASNSTRKREDLSWEDWAGRFSAVLKAYAFYLNPSQIILGGGIAKKWEKFEKHLEYPVPVSPASMGNQAGIIGAALHTLNAEARGEYP